MKPRRRRRSLGVCLLVALLSGAFGVSLPSAARAATAPRTATPAPVVYAINPSTAPVQGNTLITVFGSGFTGATAVKFGGTSLSASGCNAFFVLNDGQIDAYSPAHAAGSADVVVIGPGGSSATGPQDVVTYGSPAAPAIYGITPNFGPPTGGTGVTIHGTGLSNASSVKFGDTPSSFYVDSDNQIFANNPAGIAGTVDVTVTTTAGTSSPSLADKFSYVTPGAPTVQAVLPNHGPSAGGTNVTIIGTGFSNATAVLFGGVTIGRGNFYTSDTSIYVTAPPGTAGTTVDVSVSNAAGTSAAGSTDRYAYVAMTTPVVYGVSVNRGPTSGGTGLDLLGSGFSAATTVMFGTNAAAGVSVIDDNDISMTSPAGSAGTVDIRVTTPVGTSSANAADRFTYVPVSVPVVYGIDPHGGPATGGTLVSVYGAGFTTGSTVNFGSTPGTQLSLMGDSALTVLSPAGSGTVHVTVTNSAGTSTATVSDIFVYKAPGPPTVNAVTPNRGIAPGGNLVTLVGTSFVGATAVHFGAAAATGITVFNDSYLQVTSPAGTSGSTVHVTVTTPQGTSSSTNADQFTYFTPAVPAVTAVSPSSGSAAGGATTWISGTALSGVSAVSFGGNPAEYFQPYGDHLVKAAAPPGTAGSTVDVTVTTPGGTSGISSADHYIYATAGAPGIHSVGPSTGSTSGGSTVYISGQNLAGATAVDFGANPASFYVSPGGGVITATSPPGVAGTVDVRVTTPTGTTPITVNDQFNYTTAATPPPPVVTGVSPNTGPPNGGTTVYIRGSHFTGTSQVSFGGTIQGSILFTSDDLISVQSPSGAPSTTVDVTVTTPSGTSATSSSDQFMFGAASTPVVSGVSPATGPAAGGTTVYVSGTGFNGNPTVSFGGVAATGVSVLGDNLLSVTSPAQGISPTTVDVTVTNVGVTSATSSSDHFVYGGPVPSGLQVNGLTPNSGPSAGGTSVDIFGLGFTGATGVSFGGTAARFFFVSSDTLIVATTGTAAAGMVDVTVAVGGASSAPVAADRFTLTAPVQPAVYALDPNQGSSSGGTAVQIYGTGFSGATAVRFGGSLATSFSVIDDSHVYATSPAGVASTSVDVTVTDAAGTSATGGADLFSYVPPGQPAVYAVDPGSGTALGGTSVTIYGVNLNGGSVMFGTAPASSVGGSDSQLFVTTPPAAAGTTVDVTVTTPGGTSAVGNTDKFSFLAPAAPEVDGIAPNTGGTGGGTGVLIYGTGFSGATAVHVGSAAAAGFFVTADDLLSLTTPPGAAGTVDVTVTGPGGTSATGLQDRFTFIVSPPPTITAVSPNTGFPGSTTYVTGTGLSDVTSVNFGSNTCNGYPAPLFGGDNVLSVFVPTGQTGTVDITVTGPDGTSATTPSDLFTFASGGTPTITAVAPSSGFSQGGTSVFITGTGLSNVTGVTFGTAQATSVGFGPGFYALDDNLVVATSPAGTSGMTVDIHVTTLSGTSASTSADRFTWTLTPLATVTAVSPSSGPGGGGSLVMITGTGLMLASQVSFGSSVETRCGIFVGKGTPSPGIRIPGIQTPGVQTAGIQRTGSPGARLQSPVRVRSLSVPVLTRLQVHRPVAAGSRAPLAFGSVMVASPRQVWFMNSPSAPDGQPRTPAAGAAMKTALQAAGTRCGFLTIGDNLIEAVTPPEGSNPATVDVTVTNAGGTSSTSSSDQYTYTTTPPPAVTAVGPAGGPTAGGTSVYISGANLATTTAVHFGTTAAGFSVFSALYTGCTFYLCVPDDSLIVVTSPPATNPSTVDVTVTTAGGTSATSTSDQYVYGATPTPTVGAVAPGSGPVGTRVFITGTGLAYVTAVNFGTATAIPVHSATQLPAPAAGTGFFADGDNLLEVTSPLHASGVVDVTVVSAGGTSATGTADQYTYTASPVPVIKAIGPNGGPAGTFVYVTGSGFTGASAVSFGTAAATGFFVMSDNLVLAKSPAGTGPVDIRITNPGGTSAITSADVYSYGPVPAPTITSLSPNTGLAAGGTSVTISGTNFIAVAAVKFGTAAAASYTVNSASQITATSPAGSGTVDVTVTAAGGTSAVTAADRYTYTAGRCTSGTLISNKTSPQAGGAQVTFTAAAAGPGCTNPLFQFWTWAPATGWVVRQAYGSSATWTLDTTGMKPGTITVDVWIEQAGSRLGLGGYETFGLESWTVGGCDFATMSPNPAPTSGSVTFTATAGGIGCTTPLFQFWMWSPATGWVNEQSYSTNSSWTLNAGSLSNATYSIDVWVKQQGSPLPYETWALSTLPKGACGAATVTPSMTSPQIVGGTIVLTSAAPGCTSPQYRYWIFPGAGGSWQMLRDYSSTPTFSWNTAGLAPGTYSLVVHIRQSGSTAPYDTDALLAFSVTGSSSSTLSAAPVSPQPAGTSVVFTASAPGTAPMYQFWFYPPGGPWTIAHDFSSSATFTWNTTGLTPGTYAWVVYVKQQGSGNSFDSFALVSFTIT